MATAEAMAFWASEEGIRNLREVADLIASSIKRGGKLLLCGNGGSAGDCQHMAAEFTCRLSAARDRGPLPAIALTTDTSFITACSNDYSFDVVFARQVSALGRAGDVLVGISTGGASRNVVLAMELARSMGISTVALTRRGGAIAAMADLAIEVDSDDTAVIQNAHIAIEHAVCLLVEDAVLQGGNSIGG